MQGAESVVTELAGDAVPPLSTGACKALGTVLGRLLGSSRDALDISQKYKKRPRGSLGLILADDEDIAHAAAREIEERAHERESKRAKLRFEGLSRIVPDAATGALKEKALRETATKGVVALFNAVSKSQKAFSSAMESSKDKSSAHEPSSRRKLKEPVTKEHFMNMIRTGVNQSSSVAQSGECGASDNSDAEKKRADWLRDDFMTKGTEKLRNWDMVESKAANSGDNSDITEESDVSSDKGDLIGSSSGSQSMSEMSEGEHKLNMDDDDKMSSDHLESTADDNSDSSSSSS